MQRRNKERSVSLMPVKYYREDIDYLFKAQRSENSIAPTFAEKNIKKKKRIAKITPSYSHKYDNDFNLPGSNPHMRLVPRQMPCPLPAGDTTLQFLFPES
jgi:hypothetical protein